MVHPNTHIEKQQRSSPVVNGSSNGEDAVSKSIVLNILDIVDISPDVSFLGLVMMMR